MVRVVVNLLSPGANTHTHTHTHTFLLLWVERVQALSVTHITCVAMEIFTPATLYTKSMLKKRTSLELSNGHFPIALIYVFSTS